MGLGFGRRVTSSAVTGMVRVSECGWTHPLGEEEPPSRPGMHAGAAASVWAIGAHTPAAACNAGGLLYLKAHAFGVAVSRAADGRSVVGQQWCTSVASWPLADLPRAHTT
eukprot:359517-Chlamydomonas_euryale.AAC.24